MKLHHCFLIVLFLSVTTRVGAQIRTTELEEILTSTPDTNQVRALTALADSLRLANMDIPDELFEKGLVLAHSLNDRRGLAWLHGSRYRFLYNNNRVKEGLPDVMKTIDYADETGLSDLLREASLHLAFFYRIMGNMEGAITQATSLIRKFGKTNDLIGASEANSLMATLTNSLNDHKRSWAYDSTALALAYLTADFKTISKAATNMALNMYRTDKTREGLDIVMEAVRMAQASKDLSLESKARNCRALIYSELNNFTLAIADFEWLENHLKDRKSMALLANKGLALQKMGRHDEARQSLLAAEDLIKNSTNNHVQLHTLYRMLQAVGLSLDQTDSVMHYNQLMSIERDSIQASENLRKLLEIEEKYKAEEKEAQIQLQKAELGQQRVLLFITLGGMLASLVLGTIFFLMSRRLRRKNTENEELVHEKELLIGEVHHRVKNNLQVISSLLHLQSRGLEADDTKGRDALRESEARVYAMGLIHQKLYKGTKATAVNMPDYLVDLGATLLETYSLDEQVEIYYDITDMNLDVDIAIPLGLIINELIANALKHAFPNQREGTIEISLHEENDQLQLIVVDNGIGLVGTSIREDSTAFGNNLIAQLTEKLKGKTRKLKEHGYGVEISFEKLKEK